MSHDLWASFAISELARYFIAHPTDCYDMPPPAMGLSAFAAGTSRKGWPYEDGVVVLEQAAITHKVAVEFKRQNEGTHGVLTALGQSLAYLDKGFHGAVIVIPGQYSSHGAPGEFVTKVIDDIIDHAGLGVFTYDSPDEAATNPFAGKLTLHRKLKVDLVPPPLNPTLTSNIQTQWIHVREGSSTPSAFYRYLQTAKKISAGVTDDPKPVIPKPLRDAIERLAPGGDPVRYLSNTVEAIYSLHDNVWRWFWFENILSTDVMNIWMTRVPRYTVKDVPTKLIQADGRSPMKFFSGKSNSPKNKLVALLNAGRITENKAWEEFAKNVRSRAHSYREDIDTGLERTGLLESDGRPTDLGYRFVDACERNNDPHSGTPKFILMAALLRNGELGALLHYIYKLSEEKFRSDPLAFSVGAVFDSNAYMIWLEDKLANDLRVMRKVAARGGVARKPLQAELTIFRKFGWVSKFRTGVGLEINWPTLEEALNFPI